jgi:hypothetical protein
MTPDMKNVILIPSLFFVSVLALFFISMTTVDVDTKLAQVNEYQGIMVFVDCDPVAEYEYLGSVKKSIGLSGQYVPVRNGLIKKAKKDFPTADAIVISFNSMGADRADVIKFK